MMRKISLNVPTKPAFTHIEQPFDEVSTTVIIYSEFRCELPACNLAKDELWRSYW